jgi:uncharacterized membrane protein YbhN (UPF0104 family)
VTLPPHRGDGPPPDPDPDAGPGPGPGPKRVAPVPVKPSSPGAHPGSGGRGAGDSPKGAGNLRARLIKRGFVVVVSGLALYVVLPALGRVLSAWPRLLTLSPGWFAGAVVAEAASFACTFALQRVVLRTSGWFSVTTAGLAGNAVTNILPGGDAAGAAVQYEMLAAAGINRDTAGAGLAASSLLGIGGLLALPLFTLPAVLGGVGIRRGLVDAALLGVAAFALFTVAGVVVLRADWPLQAAGRVGEWFWNRALRRKPPVHDLGPRLLGQRDSIRSTLGSHGPQAVALVAGRLGADYLCLLGCLRATGDTPRPSLVLLAYAAAGVVALLPLTPGGLGIVEASLTGMLVLAGVPASTSLVV